MVSVTWNYNTSEWDVWSIFYQGWTPAPFPSSFQWGDVEGYYLSFGRIAIPDS